MVLKVVYSVGSEKLSEEIERRKLEQSFDALSDEYVPESEKSYNKKYKNLRIDGGKVHEIKRKNLFDRICELSKD